jgi:hypothetical protein
MPALARRSAVAIAAALALLATSAVNAHTDREMTVKTGRWHGIKWEFRAQSWQDGSYCVAMTVSGRENGRSCGNVRAEGGISYLAAIGRPVPDYVIGPVNSRARSVQITFFDRAPIRIPTIAAPPPLDPGTRFFVAISACPATPRRLVGRNASGRIVAQRVVPHRLGPKPAC